MVRRRADEGCNGLFRELSNVVLVVPDIPSVVLLLWLVWLPTHTGIHAKLLRSTSSRAVTLILTCVTRDYVVQASDRRLTFLNGDTKEVEENKAVLLCSFATFAYTGLAQLGNLSTDEWLLSHIAVDRDFFLVLDDIATQGTVVVNNTVARGLPHLQESQRRSIARICFVAAGFLSLPAPERVGLAQTSDRLYPFLALVTNFYGGRGQWLAEAKDRLEPVVQFLPDEYPYSIFVAGQDLLLEEEQHLSRETSRCIRRSTSGFPVARLLASQIRSVSRRNRFVGENVLCMVLPRPERPGRLHLTSASVPIAYGRVDEVELFRRPTGASGLPPYIYSPRDLNHLVNYGPNVGCAGLAVKGVRHGPTVDVKPRDCDMGPLTD